MKLHPYQVEGFNTLCAALALDPASAVLNASSTGVGKTVVSAAVCAHLGLRPAIICPKSVIRAWTETCAAFGVEPLFVTNYEQVKLERAPGGDWKIKKKQFRWQLPDDAVLIFDEVHHCKTKTSQNAKLLVAARNYNIRTMMLSATPAEDPLQMYALGYVLRLHNGDSDFIHWCRAHGVKRGKWGPIYRGGVEGMREIHDQIFPKKGYRAVASELPGFPSNLISTVAIDPPQRDAAKVQKELDKLFERMQEDEALPVVDNLRARQMVELLKVKAICEMAEDDVAAGNNVAIFVNFIDTLKAIEAHFGEDKCAIYHGSLSDRERELGVKRFQENRCNIIVLQVKAGGQSIDLHDVNGRPRTSYICPPDSAPSLIQAVGRICRSGALSPAVQKIVFAADSVEDAVRRRVDAKVDNIEALTDGELDIFAHARRAGIEEALLA